MYSGTIRESSETIFILVLFLFSKYFKSSIKFSFKKLDNFSQILSSTYLALFKIDCTSTIFTIFKANVSSVKETFHLTVLSLSLCLDISNKPKLLMRPI